jgi:hypothetical protein
MDDGGKLDYNNKSKKWRLSFKYSKFYGKRSKNDEYIIK